MYCLLRQRRAVCFNYGPSTVGCAAQIQQYRQQQNELRMELRNTKMDPEEARANLLAKVKEESERVTSIEKELEVLHRAIAEKREVRVQLCPTRFGVTLLLLLRLQTAESLSVKIQDRKTGGNGDAQKYELLFQRAKVSMASCVGGATGALRRARCCCAMACCAGNGCVFGAIRQPSS